MCLWVSNENTYKTGGIFSGVEGWKVPSIRPLETLHNALTLKQMEIFLKKVTDATIRTPMSSPPPNTFFPFKTGNPNPAQLPMTPGQGEEFCIHWNIVIFVLLLKSKIYSVRLTSFGKVVLERLCNFNFILIHFQLTVCHHPRPVPVADHRLLHRTPVQMILSKNSNNW